MGLDKNLEEIVMAWDFHVHRPKLCFPSWKGVILGFNVMIIVKVFYLLCSLVQLVCLKVGYMA